MFRNLVFVVLSLVLGSKICGAQVSEAKATMLFYFMVADLATRDEQLAKGFVKSTLTTTETEADHVIALAQEMVAEANRGHNQMISSLCTSSSQLRGVDVVRAIENEEARVERQVDDGVRRLRARTGSNSIVASNLSSWVNGEFKSKITEVRPNNEVAARGIDDASLIARMCQKQPLPSQIVPDQLGE